MKDVIILSAGGHGRSTLDVFNQAHNHRVLGFLDDFAAKGSQVMGVPVLGQINDIDRFVAESVFIVGRGKIGKSTHRKELAELCWSSGGVLITEVSTHAYVAESVTLGDGTVVHHGATVNVGAAIGRNCIVNSHALVEHDAVVGDHTHIATGAIVNGGCVVGENSFIGSGAVLHHQVVLPPGSVISAGDVIRKSPEL